MASKIIWAKTGCRNPRAFLKRKDPVGRCCGGAEASAKALVDPPEIWILVLVVL
ncbi:hypothetical protein HY991_05385 [Candidatus Micrarchaeota archaeon]|nr:hypothetical protein [Candidatus Micrarchaeota archaeon]